LTDLLAIVGVFILGASAGSLITHVQHRKAFDGACKSVPGSKGPSRESTATNYTMKSLVVCRSQQIKSVFSKLFSEMSIQMETCTTSTQALKLLSSQKFEALVLDFDEISGSAEIARVVREIRPNQTITAFGLASNNHQKTLALAAGCTFAVQQPLISQQVRALLHTSYGRMLRSSQDYFRLNIEIPVSLAENPGSVMKCTTINLSQNGMAIRTPRSLKIGENLHLVFALPHSDVVMIADGLVIWDDGHGKAGVHLEIPSVSAKARYFQWLHDRFFHQVEQPTVNLEVQSSSYAN
jgi:DNA-binding response OmpR family regulator